MPTQIIMPSGGQTTNESLIVKWHKHPGDTVHKGDVLFEIETDKAMLEVQSFADGILLSVNCAEGSYAASGDVVALIGQSGETAERAPVLASPKARKAAKDHAIDLADVQAQNADQILHYEQVLSSMPRPAKAAEFEAITPPSLDEIPVSPMRQAIARKMLESIQTIPQYQIMIELDMSELAVLRHRLNEPRPDAFKVSYNDLLIYTASRVLQHFPLINASFLGDRIRINRSVNFGLAVAVPEGLLVPVIYHSEQKSIDQIACENAENIHLAGAGKLSGQGQNDGTITLSSLGKYGVSAFSAIINKPESSILAIGSIQDKPTVVDGKIVIKPIMTVTATFDHRLIDGAYGAGFLNALKKVAENPSLLVYYQQAPTMNKNQIGV